MTVPLMLCPVKCLFSLFLLYAAQIYGIRFTPTAPAKCVTVREHKGIPAMKHYYVTGYRQIEESEEEIPSPGPREVLVEIAYTALSPGSNVSSYLSQVRQTRGEVLYMSSGIVRQVGQEVQRVAPGDRVALHCGHQAFACVNEDTTHRLPPALSLREASVSYLCSWSVSALHLGQYAAAETVIVIGQGMVGASAALVADMMGARVLTLDTDAKRIAFSRSLGFGAVVQAGMPDTASRVAEYVGESGADLIIETSGAWHGFRQAVELARDYTRLAIMGIYRQPPPAELGLELHKLLYTFPSKFHYQRLQIIGCGSDPDEVIYPNPHLATRPRNYAYVLEQAERGRLPLDKLITNIFQPQEVGSALAALADGNKEMVGVIFDWQATG
jgi:threonine dehydrogenase-like Zn-dependent dehydrogenase